MAAQLLALVKMPEIERISNLAIQDSPNCIKLIQFGVAYQYYFRSDVELHDVSTFNNKNLVKRSKSEKSNITSRKTSKK